MHNIEYKNKGIIYTLVNGTECDRRQAIIDAEAISFVDSDHKLIVNILKNYIEQHKHSKDDNELIAVSAATRKLVALCDTDDMKWIAELLETNPSPDIQLEICKMIFRRYSHCPPDEPDPHPELSKHLTEIATDCLNTRMLRNDRSLIISMLATQALIVMRSKSAGEIIDLVNRIPHDWFKRQLGRRMHKFLNSLLENTPGINEFQELINSIDMENKMNICESCEHRKATGICRKCGLRTCPDCLIEIKCCSDAKDEYSEAYRIAEDAHADVKRKNGDDYIEHCRRVSSSLDTTVLQTIAILHDTVEDSGYTLEDLKGEGFRDRVIMGVDDLTRRKDESYKEFIIRASKNEDARVVKIADIEDNLSDASEFMDKPKDWYRFKKYHLSRLFLKRDIDKNKYKEWEI